MIFKVSFWSYSTIIALTGKCFSPHIHLQLISSPTPNPRQSSISFLSLWVCPFWIAHMSGKEYVRVLLWVASFTEHTVSAVFSYCQLVFQSKGLGELHFLYQFTLTAHEEAAPMIVSYRRSWDTVHSLRGIDLNLGSMTWEPVFSALVLLPPHEHKIGIHSHLGFFHGRPTAFL